jgi:hypothetical protein
MSDRLPAQQRVRRWTFISVALFVIGLLILVPAGLCTLTLGTLFLMDPSDAAAFFGAVLVFGGVPMALGALLVWAGLKARTRD